MDDITDILRTFARECALDAIKVSSRCEVPSIVMECLRTGKKRLRVVTRIAAWAAASDASWAASWDDVRNAMWDDAWDGARNAVWDGAWEAQNVRLTEMVLAAARERGLE